MPVQKIGYYYEKPGSETYETRRYLMKGENRVIVRLYRPVIEVIFVFVSCLKTRHPDIPTEPTNIQYLKKNQP